MNSPLSGDTEEILKIISNDRIRTNLLRKVEQRALAFLVQRVPSWIYPDMLTLIGFIGSLIILIGFILATYFNRNFLLLGILGFATNWFGDSLDGRVAVYRNKSRKRYGFSLDVTMDWITTILIGWGYMIYAEGNWEMFGFGFVVMYGWAIITTLIRYKITGKYTIDSGLLGPTEVRIIVSAILVLEVLVEGSVLYFSALACAILFLVNVVDTLNLLRLTYKMDMAEKEENMKKGNV